MIKSIIPIIVFIALPFGLFASPQVPDYIIYKNDTIATYNLIFEQYLQKIEKSETENLFVLNFRNLISSNCWRGYQAIYKIEKDSLFLSDIINCGELANKVNKSSSLEKMRNFFGDKVKNNKVFIDWFSGDLSFPVNNKVVRWDGIFYKIFEKETVVTLLNGTILKIKNVDNYIRMPNAIDRKGKDKVSEALFKKLKKAKWKNKDDFDCSEKYFVTINEKGKVSKVRMEYETQEEIEKYYERQEYNFCVDTIYKALKDLQFDLILDKGNPVSEEIYIELFYDDKKGILENRTR